MKFPVIEKDPEKGAILAAYGPDDRKTGPYIAKIIGFDKKFKYKRVFISETIETKSGVKAVCPLDKVNGDLLEIRHNKSKNFYKFFQNKIQPISEDELRNILSQWKIRSKAINQ